MTTKRKQIISLVVIILVSAVLTMLLVSLKSSPKRKPPIDTRPVVGVMTVQNNPVQLTVPVIGRLSAQEKVSILAEVTGVLEINNKEFLTGQSYRKGDVMLRINPEETALTLKSQRSSLLTAIASLLPELKFDHPESYKQWNDYIQACDIESRAQPLPEPVDEREKLFVAARGIYTTSYQIKSLEARVEKFTIRAPFDGVLIQSNITPGNLVRVGQPLGVLINPARFDFESSVSIEEIDQIHVGDQVLLYSDNITGSWQGFVTRINLGLDENNQMVKVFASFAAPELRDGMFLRGDVLSSTSVNGLELPRKMLHNGNTVLELVDGTIHYRKVQVISTSGEMAVVMGLQDGTKLSTKTLNLYDGAKVKVPGMDAEKPQDSEKKKG